MAGEFRRRLLKPSPWGEGGWPPGQTDEGTIIERFRFSQGGFAAPAATYFAHGGKVGKTPPGFAQDGSSAPIFAHPGPRLRGLPLEHCAALPARKIRSAWVRFRPAPLGACVCINFRAHTSAAAPQFAEPTSPVRERPLPGPLAGIPRRRSGTAPLKFSSHSGPGGPAKI